MAQNYGPRISTENLLLCLDPSQNKSYPATDLPVKDGLIMWMDAADDTTFSYSSGTTVSQWRDKSGFNYHMTPTSAGPTRSSFLNSRKVLAFTSSQDIRNLSIDLRSSAYTVFVVSRYSGGVPYRVLTSTTSSNWLLGHWSGFVNQYYALGWVQYQGYSTDSVWRMYMGDWSGASTDLANMYSNGTSLVANSNQASDGPFTLGINAYTGERSECEAAEIIVFNRVLSTRERHLINTYLGQKWGISNTDRQIFDLSGNNFNFLFNGTNPRYNAKTIVSNFNTSTPYAVSSFGGQNLTSSILNLLYTDHTIEVAVNPKGFLRVVDLNAALPYEGAQGVVLWTGQHGGLYFDGYTLFYLIWNGSASTPNVSYNALSLKDRIIYITATRQGNVITLYVNGVLVSGPYDMGATTALNYTQINIGCAYQGSPANNAFIWAGQHEYHLVRMYNRRLSAGEVSSNYEAFKARFSTNIVRYGLIMELDAANPLSYAGSGSVWYDVSGNTNHATLYNSPTWNSNGYFSLNGTNNYIKTTSTLNLSTYNAVTVLVIFKARSYPASGNTKFICELSTDFNSFQYGFVWTYNDNSASQNYDVFAGVKGNNGYNLGVWNKSNYNDLNWEISTAVFDKSQTTAEASLYNQGVTATVIANPLPSLASNNTNNFGDDYLFIGSRAGTSYFTDLDIASILVYNRALSAAEILQNYNAMKGRFGL